MMVKIHALVVLTSLAAVVPSTGATTTMASTQPLADIEEAARNFLEHQSGEVDGRRLVTVSHVDSRLRLPLCDTALAGFAPPSAHTIGNVTVGVHCRGSRSWTVYIAARVEVRRPVLVLVRPIPRGHLLAPADIQLEERDASKLGNGYLTSIAAAVGMEARSPLRAGFVLNPNVLTPPLLVKRGERVTILAQSGGFEVRSEAQALQDGSRGELISVRNLHSSRIVEGVVTGSGLIEIRM